MQLGLTPAGAMSPRLFDDSSQIDNGCVVNCACANATRSSAATLVHARERDRLWRVQYDEGKREHCFSEPRPVYGRPVAMDAPGLWVGHGQGRKHGRRGASLVSR